MGHLAVVECLARAGANLDLPDKVSCCNHACVRVCVRLYVSLVRFMNAMYAMPTSSASGGVED